MVITTINWGCIAYLFHQLIFILLEKYTGLREDLWLLKPLTPSSHHPGLPSGPPIPVCLPWLAAGACMAQEISSVDGGGVGVELCFGFLLI